MKKVLLLLAIAAIGFTSCKKDEPTPEKTTKEKIVGAWMGDKVDIVITIPPAPTQNQSEDISYLNVTFKSDNTVSIDSAGVSQGFNSWSLIDNDTKLILDSDTFDIQTINDSQFYFGLSENIDLGGGVTGSFKQTIKLKK